MKKVLLGVVFCAMGTFAFGQKALPQVEGQKGYIAAPILKKDVLKKTTLNKKDNVAGWYGYIDATSKLEVIAYTFFNNVSLFPDSTVKQIYGDGAGGQMLGHVALHAVGQVFDPKSAYFSDDELGTAPLSKYNKYRWDSVALFYTNYQYHVPGSVDTLIFQFYTTKNSGIRTADLSNGEQTTLVGYSKTTNLGTGAAGVYKYLLDEKDTATDRFSVISVPVMNGTVPGIDVPANGLAGFTVSYRPGYSYSLNDTLDSRWTSPVPTKKLNHFRVLVGQDQEKSEHESYNHGMRVIKATRYEVPGNGWNKYFIPGDAWNAYNEHVYSTFHITASGVSVEENGPFKGYGVGSIYPNPASGIANLTFELGKTENVNIAIYNVVGQKMSNVANGTYAAGKHNLTFSVENLNAGVYFYTINAGGYNKTLKFTVVK